ncbi:MAG TPA: FtsX-like permease family protein [Candidatus Limnocylindrales bacterium]|nr:FtsX-like permease family protein [Candidatus Limnocylindrales bacterium]
MSAFLVTLRRIREDRVPTVGIAVVILITATVFAVTPRLLDRVADDAFRGVVRQATAFNRNVALIEEQVPPPRSADAPLAEVNDEGERLVAKMPASVQGLISARSTVIDSERWSLRIDTPDPTFVRFRIQPGAETRLHYVAGRPPTPAITTVALPPPAQPTPGGDQQTAKILEVAIAADAARPIGHGLGETIMLRPDGRDALVGGERTSVAGMKVVGLFAVDDPSDPFWYEDHGLEHVTYRSLGGDSLLVDVTALIPVESYLPMLQIVDSDITAVRATWRSFIDPARLRTADLDPLVRDLRKLDTVFPRSQPGARPSDAAAMQSGLLNLVTTHQGRWTSALAILTVVAIGPVAVAFGALALVAAVAARRRRPALALVRNRGASLGQAIRAVLLEGALIAIPSAAVAIAVAFLVIPSDQQRPTILAATVVGVVAVILLVVTGLSGTAVRAGGRGSDGDGAPASGPSVRRLVLDATIVLVAAGAAYLLRERGVRGASAAGTLQAADPLIAAVPALAGLAAGVAAVRLVPLPLRALGRVAARGRGFVALLALRRAASGGTTAPLIIVLLGAASIGTFASTALVHLDRASEASTWQAVGAPFRVASNAGSLPHALDLTKVSGVRAVANDFQALVAFGTSRIRAQLNAIDAPVYESIIGGSPGDPELPAEMLGAAPAVLPVVVSSSLATRADGVKVGQEFDILVDGIPFPVRVTAVRDTVAGLPSGGLFVVISRTQMKEKRPGLDLAPSTLFVDAADDGAGAIRDAVAAATPAATVDARTELEQRFTDSPVTAAIIAGVALSAFVAAVYAALAVAAALALAGAARLVEVAQLRTLGLSRRQASALALIEHGPTVLFAFAAGVALGLGLFALLEPGLGLDALVGSRVDVPLSADPRQLGLIFLGVLVIAGIGIALAAWTQRRGAPVAALRRGAE